VVLVVAPAVVPLYGHVQPALLFRVALVDGFHIEDLQMGGGAE